MQTIRAKHISQKKIMKIIKLNNTLHVCTIADNIENFIKCDSCKLVKILSHHKTHLSDITYCPEW